MTDTPDHTLVIGRSKGPPVTMEVPGHLTAELLIQTMMPDESVIFIALWCHGTLTELHTKSDYFNGHEIMGAYSDVSKPH